MDQKQANTHILALDGLRGLAVLTVVISHFSNETGILDKTLGLGAGKIGVMVFFMLSGFLMAYLYLDVRFRSSAVIDFYVKRFARVLPLYMLSVILAFMLLTAFSAPILGYDVNRDNLLTHLFALEGEGILWTIPVEIQFYLIFPLIWLAYSLIGNKVIFPILGILALSLAFPQPFAFGVVPYIQFFLAGILVHFTCQRLKRMPIWLLPALLVIYVATMPAMLPLYGLAKIQAYDLWTSAFYLPLIYLLTVAAIKSTSAPMLLGGNVMRWVGRVSYSAYLLHYPLLGVVIWATPGVHVWLVLAVFLLATAGLSELSYRFVEAPMRRSILNMRPHINDQLGSYS